MDSPFQQNVIIETAPIQEEIILFHPETNKFCILNRTSSFIWSCLQQPTTAAQIVEEISKSFQEVTMTEAMQDVNSILQDMLSLDLIVDTT